MKKIYLILAHKSPEQLERQINALYDIQSTFYIHVDLKTNLNLFSNLEKFHNVILINDRVDCIWGDFSIISATLNLIKNAIKNHTEGFCILMSGNDYPIKSRSFINSFINQNKTKIFIDLKEAESIWSTFDDRIKKYRINISSNRGNALLIKQGLTIDSIKLYINGRISFNDLKRVLFKKRKLNIKIKFYGGSQWWAMNIYDLGSIYDFIETNKRKLFDFFKYSHIPDEFFFHSIIMYLFEKESPQKINDSLTYVNWTKKNCSLPVTFTDKDFYELMEQPAIKLFARKFDLNVNEKILDEIDKNISKTL